MTEAKIARINLQILRHIARGMEVPAAFDAVVGTGAYERMIEEIRNARPAQGIAS